MIRCPKCSEPLDEGQRKVEPCGACGWAPRLTDGVVSFEPDMGGDPAFYDPRSLDALYRFERSHFWFRRRREYIVRMFRRHVPRDQRVLEIGAGTGNVARALHAAGYRIAVGELHLNGLRYAASYGLEDLYQFDLLHAPFENHFDAVGLFDVLEHVPDDAAAVRGLHRLLRPGGHAIITVPAHSWLWNREDALAHHCRRYTLRHLAGLFRAAGFEIRQARYIFVAILPLLLMRVWLKPARNDPPTDQEIDTVDIGLPWPLDRLLDWLCLAEFALIDRLPSVPAGGSIALVARKADANPA